MVSIIQFFHCNPHLIDWQVTLALPPGGILAPRLVPARLFYNRTQEEQFKNTAVEGKNNHTKKPAKGPTSLFFPLMQACFSQGELGVLLSH